MNAVVQSEEFNLPAPVARRNISEAAWRTAMSSLFPGAKAESVLMVFDYCAARKLDPLKKPCHIVPMRVKDAKSGDYVWRDVVMPGIYEYRMTATRTGLYLGHSKPVYGPMVEFLGEQVPEWCEITVYRWNVKAGMKAEYPVQLKFSECAGTKKDKQTGKFYLNDRWSTAKQQMLTKCTEAAALREAFPDELGGTHTAEEMEGQDKIIDVTPSMRIDPRPDTSNVDFELVNTNLSLIADILAQDKEEDQKAAEIALIADELNKSPELYSAVFDRAAKEGILSKSGFNGYLAMAKKKEGKR